ncbi:ACT domain-containing protein [Actinoallomurus rhizosphaericola]|uniref:ACT domain-containing protein n=1 Tax=Actinoallomurus rhizosphaericola TaxID=2952536 RepID=UPI0020935DD3|nr:ACT domain-containing protein [Actinoallomurus rhizosphaericola]MCO5997027.1 ACT domain-containing protein [Actinoallomurus rhizosphaericola]
MHDLTIELDDEPGALAAMGEALGAGGVSVEGGGVFVVGGRAVAHFLFDDGVAASAALRAAGLRVTACREVLARRLDQDRPGQLGAISRALADAGVNIEVLYSDHDHRLILVVDDPRAGAEATAAWDR